MIVGPTQLKRIHSLLSPQTDVSGIVEFLDAKVNTIGGWTDLVAEMDDLQIRKLVALCNLEVEERSKAKKTA